MVSGKQFINTQHTPTTRHTTHNTPSQLKLGVLVSGNGSNLQAIINSVESKKLNAEISVVLCNRPEAFAVKRAQKHKIPVEIIEQKGFKSREDYDSGLIKVLEKYETALVVLAGFDRILSPLIVRHFKWRIMNIHPALLPSFPGLHGIQQAFDYGVRWTGVTVHFVDEGTDTGPIILQAAVPIKTGDTLDTLEKKIHEEEHRLYPEAIQLFADNRLKVLGRKVTIPGT